MSKLHAVGASLCDSAKSIQSDHDLADAFGRSAFNRYYYAAYLSVRDLLLLLNSDWLAKHADAPGLVEKNVVDLIRAEARRQEKLGLISSAGCKSICSQAAKSAAEIANTLRTGYKVRVISDYSPSQLVSFERNTFVLDAHTEGQARAWLKQVELHKGQLLHISKDLGLVS